MAIYNIIKITQHMLGSDICNVLNPFIFNDFALHYSIQVKMVNGEFRRLCEVIDLDRPTEKELNQLKANIRLLKLELL